MGTIASTPVFCREYLSTGTFKPSSCGPRSAQDGTGIAKAPWDRRKVEALFAELKNGIGLRRLRLRRLQFVREQFYLAATVQNMKRLVRFLKPRATEPVPATA